MTQKILIVGGVAGGASAAARLRRQSEDDQIIMFERGPHVSFSNCSLPYYLSETIQNADSLVLMSPEKFLKQYNIQARVNNEVIAIDRKNKTVSVKNVLTNEIYTEHYDKLILSPGAKPIVPPIPGKELVNIFTVRNVVDITKLKQSILEHAPRNIAVIGGGFIGVEVAENLREAGYKVSLIEAMPQIMRTFDYDMVQILHKEMSDHGIDLIVNDKVDSFAQDQVILGSGKTVLADVVIMAIGVAPETDLAKQAELTIGKTGAIAVNDACQTNDPDIYAVGDAIEVSGALFEDKFKLALAWPAQIQARGVADHINGKEFKNLSYLGSSCIKIFDYNAASTGLTEGFIQATKMKIDYEIVMITPNDQVSLMPTNHTMFFKLLFEKVTGRVLGAQAIGKGNVDKRVDVIATAIKFNATVQDLIDLELCYAPPFSTAKDVVNMAGYVATNLLENRFKQISVAQVRELVQQDALILDVREAAELAKGRIINSLHIPLSELRTRVNELPRDQPIYIHCRSGQRSYNAVLMLQNLGYTQVFNLAGGFLSLSFYEAFNDQDLKRSPIVTTYNFN
ncbi:MAG: FAD-dependent oxidoreductase [Burkholderiales bacterium]|nr:FAD-dependent oxidoreductase [Burkholderiales bacterium]